MPGEQQTVPPVSLSVRASAWVSGPATNARHEQGDMGQRPARFVCAHGLSSASPPRPQRDGTQDTKEPSTYSESSPGSCKPSSPVHGDTVQGTTVTWGPGRPPGRYGQEEQGPPGQGTGWHGTRVSCGLGPLRAGDPHVTENVLENAGELAVAEGDVVSVLRQGPQDVREGRQAPVYERGLPESRSCHSRHTWDGTKPPSRGQHGQRVLWPRQEMNRESNTVPSRDGSPE